MRRERVRIAARRHLLDDDVGKLEIEPPGGDRRDLRQRRVLHNRDRTIGRLAPVALDNLATSGCRCRSNTIPRGARSASVRWWLFSAISSNFACSTTCSTQKLTARIENTTVRTYCRSDMRIVIRRRSSCDAIFKMLTPEAGAARLAPLHRSGQKLN